MTGRNTAARELALIFAAAFLFRLLFVLYYPWAPDDVPRYQQLARNMLAGHGFSSSATPPYRPDMFRTPVFPLFVAVLYASFGVTDVPVHVMQAAIGALTCCVIYVLARRFFPPSTALLAAMLNAFYPYSASLVSATV